MHKSIKAIRQEKLSYKPINVDELQDAESEIIRIVQNKAFEDEIVLLRHQDPQSITPPPGDVRNQVRKTVKTSWFIAGTENGRSARRSSGPCSTLHIQRGRLFWTLAN
jgi:hypothetical protein